MALSERVLQEHHDILKVEYFTARVSGTPAHRRVASRASNSGPSTALGAAPGRMVAQMSDAHARFWVALMNHHRDREQRARLWNGYLGWKLPPRLRGEVPQSGWPQLIVDAPPGGWPALSDDDKSLLDLIAAANGGHPSWNKCQYMDFSGYTFGSGVDLFGCTLVDADFNEACFTAEVKFETTRFFAQSWFRAATFEEGRSLSQDFLRSRRGLQPRSVQSPRRLY